MLQRGDAGLARCRVPKMHLRIARNTYYAVAVSAVARLKDAAGMSHRFSHGLAGSRVRLAKLAVLACAECAAAVRVEARLVHGLFVEPSLDEARALRQDPGEAQTLGGLPIGVALQAQGLGRPEQRFQQVARFQQPGTL